MKSNTLNTSEVNSLVDILRQSVHQELSRLSETLDQLDPVQRLNIVCKLLPYVLPKAETVEVEEEQQQVFKVTLNI